MDAYVHIFYLCLHQHENSSDKSVNTYQVVINPGLQQAILKKI